MFSIFLVCLATETRITRLKNCAMFSVIIASVLIINFWRRRRRRSKDTVSGVDDGEEEEEEEVESRDGEELAV